MRIQPHRALTVIREWTAGSALLLVAVGVACVLRLEAAPGQGAPPVVAPPAWSPPSAPSPLREIWSFDTKG
jgi:hypothetical protein